MDDQGVPPAEAEKPAQEMALLRHFGAPAVACIASQLLFLGLKQRVWIQPELWHLLDFDALRGDFADSIALLHSNPPGLSLVFGVALHVERFTGCSLQAQITTLYVALTCGALFLWHEVALRTLRSAMGAAAVMALLVANPALVVQQAWAFTPPIELFLLGAFCLAATSWYRRPSWRRLAAMAAVFVALVYTRSLWHPLSALPVGAGLGIAAWRKGLPRRRSVLVAVAFVGMVWGAAFPWMMKNEVLFGRFGFTSWMSFNMRLGYNGVWRFVDTGEYDEKDAIAYYPPKLLEKLRANDATGKVWKTFPDGRRFPNLNHFSIPVLDTVGVRQIRDAIVEDPGLLVPRTIQMAQCFDMPGYYAPTTINFHTGEYVHLRDWRWCHLHDMVLHGSWMRRFVHVSHPQADWYMSFSFIVLCGALATATVRSWRMRDEREFGVLLCVGCFAWVMGCILLVDGYEGSRMRWHVQPVALIAMVGTAQAAISKMRGSTAGSR